MTGHTAPIQSLSFSAESSLLLSGSQDCTVRCWDVKSAGGPRSSNMNMRNDNNDSRRNQPTVDLTGGAGGTLPMGPGELSWEEMGQT